MAIAQERPDTPRIGLVLSGGSARGLAHVGVLNVLHEERIPIDVVTGTSMGAIIGGLYALGYSPAEIERLVLEQDWDALFSDKASRRSELLEHRLAGQGVLISVPFKDGEIQLPSGVFSGQQAMNVLSRISWGFHHVDDLTQLPVPYTAVATQLRSGEAVALTNVPVATAIRASMSLPSVFVPVEIDGELYIDGGLARNIPAQDAQGLGADYLIGVDVGVASDSVSFANLSFLDVLVEAAFFQAARYSGEQRALLDVLITPDTDNLSRADFNSVAEWIERGEVAARAAVPALRALIDSLDLGPAEYVPLRETEPSAVFVSEIEVLGENPEAVELARTRMRIEPNNLLRPEQIEAAIGRIYGTGLFDLVTYRILPDGAQPQQWVLEISLVPRRAPNRLGVGLRYDSRYKAALLIDATFWGTGINSGTSSIRVRLGDQIKVSGSRSARTGQRARFNLGGRVSYARSPVDVYLPNAYAERLGVETDVPVFALTIASTRADFFAGYASHESLRAGLMIRLGHTFVDQRVSGRQQARDTTAQTDPILTASDGRHELVAGGAYLQFDTFDAVDFATRGARAAVTAEVGSSDAQPQFSLGNPANKSRALGPYFYASASADWRIPLRRGLSAMGSAAGMFGAGEHLPTIYYSFLGGRETVAVLTDGYLPFFGLKPQQRFGRKAWMGSLGIQWEIREGLFAQFIANAGDTFDLFSDDDRALLSAELYDDISDDFALGYAIELGLRTRGGPVRIGLEFGGPGKRADLGFRFGYHF